MAAAGPPIALPLALAFIAVLGTGISAFLGVWSAHRLEAKRQAFLRDQDAAAERARTMQAARILDSTLQAAEALLRISIVKDGRLWPDTLEVPDTAIWPELRASVAVALDPTGWIAVNVGFYAVDHLRAFGGVDRELHHDNAALSPERRQLYEPVMRHITAAREAIEPLAYPDHVRLQIPRASP